MNLPYLKAFLKAPNAQPTKTTKTVDNGRTGVSVVFVGLCYPVRAADGRLRFIPYRTAPLCPARVYDPQAACEFARHDPLLTSEQRQTLLAYAACAEAQPKEKNERNFERNEQRP